MIFITLYSFFFALYFKFEDVQMVTIAQLGLSIIVYFGCYSMINIGYHLIILEDCKDAQDELWEDIKAAKKDLTSKGMKL